MNIVLINLTRFGDQLQSQAAINALAGKDGPNRICLVTLANFASGAVFLHNVALTQPLPKDAFLSGLEADWPAVAGRLWEWKRELFARFRPDLVCNITPSVPARLLGRFLAGNLPYTGYGLDEFGFGTASPWAAFFQGSSQRRELSPFNLVDLFRAVAGASAGPPAAESDFRLAAPAPDSEAALRVDAMLRQAAPAKRLVAFQLGASEERRRWPAEYFAGLGRALWHELGCLPVLLGGKGEEHLAARYAEAAANSGGPAAPHLSLVGRTGLEELACALRRADLLVSNDTGTMHLAAGLGRPVLGIFLATAQAWDTGPYLEGSCALEPGLPCHPCAFGSACPRDEKCRLAIGVDEVARLCAGFLRSGAWPRSGTVAGGPRLWLSCRDEFGFMNLLSLSGHEDETRTVWFREQRRFLRQFLDRDPAAPFNYASPAEKLTLPAADREKLAAGLAHLQAGLRLLAELGDLLLEKPLPRLRERFIAALRKVDTDFEHSGHLLALGLLWQVEVQAKGDDLAAALVCIKQYLGLVNSLLQRVNS